jgi:formate/nitrite transporter
MTLHMMRFVALYEMRNLTETIEIANNSAQLKASHSSSKLLILSILAGMFIAFGAIFYLNITSYGGNIGAMKILGGLGFSLGLILVVIAGAELFTGNNLLIVALLNKKITFRQLMKNWTIVYLGNFFGSVLIAAIFYGTNQHLGLEGELSALGFRAQNIAIAKMSVSIDAIFFRAILCNTLVCLAVWMAMVAKSFSGKVLGIIFPIAGFVAMGFEHCIANMFFIPYGLMTLGSEVSGIGYYSMMTSNIMPVTLGNMVGGVLFVALPYWYVSKKS